MELTFEEKLNIAIKNYEIAYELVLNEELSNYRKKGLTEDDAAIIVGQKVKAWLEKNGR